MDATLQVLVWIVTLISTYFAVFWFLVLIDEPARLQRRHWHPLPMLTVVIPAFNEEDCIRDTMESVLAVEYPHNRLQLIVVDDGSKDRTAAIAAQVKAEHPSRDITLIKQKNAGKGAALNKGLALAKGVFFATMDSDSRVYPDAPKTLLSYFVSANIAAVVPSMKVREPKTFLQKLQWYEYNVNMFYKELMGRVDALHVIPGPFPVYRTDVLRKIDGFVTDGNLTEDLEITLRLQSKQYRIVQVMDAVVDTITPDTFKSFYAQRNRWFKGAFLNALKYKWMAFNRKFGDFGMIQMPTLIISGLLGVILVGVSIYSFVKPAWQGVSQLAAINFDILTLLTHLSFNLNIFDFDFMNIVLAVSMIGLSVFIFIQAHRMTNESMLKQGWLSLGFFLTVYYLVLGIVWAGVVVDLVRGKHQRW